VNKLAKLLSYKSAGKKLTCLTAYDASFARLLDSCGVDILLVGDSLGMVVQGHQSTVPVTLDDMIYHSSLVRRGAPNAWLIADLPFMAAVSLNDALYSAKQLLQQGGVQMVKIEGDQSVSPIISALTQQGVPVCAHLGLLPQQALRLGYKTVGKTADESDKLLEDAIALEDAGASMLVLECVVPEVAARISQALTIPTIGIGSGNLTDGQVLVLHDVLGLSAYPPSFAPSFLTNGRNIEQAIIAFITDVRSGLFPKNREDKKDGNL
jgi:3-methyl-2-oxobutanoate hydroxymethyltransferase